MSARPAFGSAQPPRGLVIAAFAAIYLFWGSTYLGIRFAIETIPPFLMAGGRFLLAGLLLYGFARLKSHERPSLMQWRDAAVVGCLLLAVGNGSVTYVEQRLPSTLVALIIALTPVWMVVIDWWRGGARPSVPTLVGLALGIAGVVIIIAPRGDEPLAAGHLAGIAILLAATISWAYGSVWSRQADKPASALLLVGMQMTTAGLALLVLGLLSGESRGFDPGSISTKSILAWLYLLTAGSVIGFTAYVWLLQVTSTARVATHAYVNPVIAVVLGIFVGGETLSTHAAAGGALVVLAVVLILRVPKDSAQSRVLTSSSLSLARPPVPSAADR